MFESFTVSKGMTSQPILRGDTWQVVFTGLLSRNLIPRCEDRTITNISVTDTAHAPFRGACNEGQSTNSKSGRWFSDFPDLVFYEFSFLTTIGLTLPFIMNGNSRTFSPNFLPTHSLAFPHHHGTANCGNIRLEIWYKIPTDHSPASSTLQLLQHFQFSVSADVLHFC